MSAPQETGLRLRVVGEPLVFDATRRGCGFCGEQDHRTADCRMLADLNDDVAAMAQHCTCCHRALSDEARCCWCGAHQP